MTRTMRVSTFAIAVLLVVAGAGSALAAEDDYEVDITPAVEVPDRTAEIDSKTFPVSALGRVDPGGAVTVEVTAPDVDYRVVVYDAFRNVRAEQEASGDAAVQFDTDGWTAGSYVVAVERFGDVVAVQPLVVSAYDLDVTSTERATPGSMIRVAADLDPVDGDASATRVTALISGDGGEEYQALRQDDDGTYVGTISIDGLPAGEYTVHVIVQGSKVQYGARETIALTDGHPLTIGESAEGTERAPETTVEPGEQGDGETTTVGDVETTREAATEPPETAQAEVDEPALESASLTGWGILPALAVALLLVVLVSNRLR